MNNIFKTLDRQDRTQVFIDAPNLLASLKQIGDGRGRVDYINLRAFFATNSRLVRMHYLATVRVGSDDNNNNDDAQTRLLDMLSYKGFRVFRKPVRIIRDEVTNATRIKGSVSVDLALQVVKAAEVCDHIVLFSGDGELLPAIEAAQEAGAKVTVVSTKAAASDDVCRTADEFVDLIDLLKIMQHDNEDAPTAEGRNTAVRKTAQVVVETKAPRRVVRGNA